ncbi:MAG: hypothetical protein R2912_10570 [Eubacteriales bacterium]
MRSGRICRRLDELRKQQDGMIYISLGDERYRRSVPRCRARLFPYQPHRRRGACPFSPVSGLTSSGYPCSGCIRRSLRACAPAALLSGHHNGACALFGKDEELAAVMRWKRLIFS